MAANIFHCFFTTKPYPCLIRCVSGSCIYSLLQTGQNEKQSQQTNTLCKAQSLNIDNNNLQQRNLQCLFQDNYPGETYKRETVPNSSNKPISHSLSALSVRLGYPSSNRSYTYTKICCTITRYKSCKIYDTNDVTLTAEINKLA